ncbi:MAG: ABC transporter ATP-binding protein [Cyanobacteriota bacterium]|nr:ABC transporter ATP-binding protein [Cyanobacteriota bacterium]
MGSVSTAIQLQDLSRCYGSQVALDGLNLSIGAGEFFSLLGPSGCGKTTTLRLIAGFERPDRGRVHLQGSDLTEAPPHRRPVNLVFQNYALFPHLNVWDNVAFGPRSRRLGEAELQRRVSQQLEVVGLAGLARRRPHQLSGGQQQRVALARALVNAPAALLLDEPLAALDPDLRRTMRTELQRIQRQVGITFLLVTHDREEALSLSDRLAVLHAGRLEQVGTPRQLYDHPRSAVVATFLGTANLLNEGSGAVRLLRPERLRLRAEAPGQGEQGLRARVQELVFQGATVEVRLSTPGDQPLVALITGAALPDHLRIGSELWCCWDPADCHLLEESP